MDEFLFPWAVMGPRDFAPLMRDARICASVRMKYEALRQQAVAQGTSARPTRHLGTVEGKEIRRDVDIFKIAVDHHLAGHDSGERQQKEKRSRSRRGHSHLRY
jgi:hypothetical protein